MFGIYAESKTYMLSLTNHERRNISSISDAFVTCFAEN